MLTSGAVSFVLTLLVKLAGELWGRWRYEQETKAAGRAEAVAESRAAAAAATATARDVEAEADRHHAADASDAAFDNDFRRT